MDDFDYDEYQDACQVCGNRQIFCRRKRAIRETYNCDHCGASLRERAHADLLVRMLARTSTKSIKDLVEDGYFSKLSVYEPGTTGAIRKFLKNIPSYFQSDFYVDVEKLNNENLFPPHQDLQNLTFDSAIFDIVISSDIIEHVRSPIAAFKETYRVLKPGGFFCFTVPLQEPLKSETVVRVDTTTPVDIHILPPHYHGDGKGGKSLVYHDFGRDITKMLEQVGFIAGLARSTAASELASRPYTVFAIKL